MEQMSFYDDPIFLRSALINNAKRQKRKFKRSGIAGSGLQVVNHPGAKLAARFGPRPAKKKKTTSTQEQTGGGKLRKGGALSKKGNVMRNTKSGMRDVEVLPQRPVLKGGADRKKIHGWRDVDPKDGVADAARVKTEPVKTEPVKTEPVKTEPDAKMKEAEEEAKRMREIEEAFVKAERARIRREAGLPPPLEDDSESEAPLENKEWYRPSRQPPGGKSATEPESSSSEESSSSDGSKKRKRGPPPGPPPGFKERKDISDVKAEIAADSGESSSEVSSSEVSSSSGEDPPPAALGIFGSTFKFVKDILGGHAPPGSDAEESAIDDVADAASLASKAPVSDTDFKLVALPVPDESNVDPPINEMAEMSKQLAVAGLHGGVATLATTLGVSTSVAFWALKTWAAGAKIGIPVVARIAKGVATETITETIDLGRDAVFALSFMFSALKVAAGTGGSALRIAHTAYSKTKYALAILPASAERSPSMYPALAAAAERHALPPGRAEARKKRIAGIAASRRGTSFNSRGRRFNRKTGRYISKDASTGASDA